MEDRLEILHLEGIPGLHEFGLGGENYRGFRQADRHIHTHDIVEMVYVYGGHGRHLLGGREQAAGPGSLAIIHYQQAHGFDTGTHGLDLLNLYLDLKRYPLPPMPEDLERILPAIIPIHPNLGHTQRELVHLQFDDSEHIRRILFSLVNELQASKPGALTAVNHWMSLFLIECCRQYQTRNQRTAEPGQADYRTERLERLRTYIDSHFTEALTLDGLARYAGWQKNYLCRIFKAHTGQTIFHYLIHRRLERALVLLRQTDRKIIDIAQDCGFNDLPYFNRLFKRELSVTPSAYRREWETPPT